MTGKSQQLQIRVTPKEKAALRRLAKGAGLDVSGYVLSKALPPKADRFQELTGLLSDEESRRYALAEMNDLLVGTAPADYLDIVANVSFRGVDQLWQNYVAAMVEQGASMKGVNPPGWVTMVEPLSEPWFATQMRSLRMHLLQASPVPFKRRNLFIDSSLGARV